VGEGPFPTELFDATAEEMRRVGYEYGTTTGRPRRCGWLDIPQLRYSCLINGFTSLILTKLDVLDGLKEIKIGVRYMYKGKELDTMPSNLKVRTRGGGGEGGGGERETLVVHHLCN